MTETDTPDPSSMSSLVREAASLYRTSLEGFSIEQWDEQWQNLSGQIALISEDGRRRAIGMSRVVAFGTMIGDQRPGISGVLKKDYSGFSDEKTAQFLTHLTIGRVAYAIIKSLPPEIGLGVFRAEFDNLYEEILVIERRDNRDPWTAAEPLTLEEAIGFVLDGSIRTGHLTEQIEQAELSPTMRELGDIEERMYHYQLTASQRDLLLRMLHMRSQAPWYRYDPGNDPDDASRQLEKDLREDLGVEKVLEAYREIVVKWEDEMLRRQ